MNKPHLLLVILLFAALSSCGERRANKKAAKRGFIWELKGEQGIVQAKDIRSLLKKYPKVFGNTSILNDFNDTDTAGFFVQEKDYVWMALYTSQAENAMGYLCAKRQKNGYFLVLSDAGSEFRGPAQQPGEYLSKAGPYIILKQPAGNRIAPEIYTIDGTEVYTNDLLVGGSYCTNLPRAVPDTCYSEHVRFVYANGRLESIHDRAAVPENTPGFVLHRSYKVHYTVQENDLRSRDTIVLP